MFQVYLPTQVTANCSVSPVCNFAQVPWGWEVALEAVLLEMSTFPAYLSNTKLSSLWSGSGKSDGYTAGKSFINGPNQKSIQWAKTACLRKKKNHRTSYWVGKKVIGLLLIVPKKVLYVPKEQQQSCWITMRKSLYLADLALQTISFKFLRTRRIWRKSQLCTHLTAFNTGELDLPATITVKFFTMGRNEYGKHLLLRHFHVEPRL